MRWRRSANTGSDGSFLEGTASDLADFGQSGSEGFAEAWSAIGDEASHGDRDLFEQSDDRRSRRARDLDRRSRRWVLPLIGLLLAGVAAAIILQTDVFGESTANLPEGTDDVVLELLSIGTPRVYQQGPTDIELTDPTTVDRPFLTVEESDPQPTDSPPGWTSEVRFGPVFWGGRSHVALVGPSIGTGESCVVVSLVADDFRVVDIATYGLCGDAYAATGDRSACVGSDVLVLEVWPFDPDSVVDKPTATALRVRVQRVDDVAGNVESIRGVMDLGGDLVERADLLRGAPGDTAELGAGAGRAKCELLDRSGVQVQLL